MSYNVHKRWLWNHASFQNIEHTFHENEEEKSIQQAQLNISKSRRYKIGDLSLQGINNPAYKLL